MQQLKIISDRIGFIHGKKQKKLNNPRKSTTQENAIVMAMHSVAVFYLSNPVTVSWLIVLQSSTLFHFFMGLEQL